MNDNDIKADPRPEPDGYLTIKIIGRDVEVNAYRDSTLEAYTREAVRVNAKEIEDTVMQLEDKMQDKNGNVIKAGDTLFNPYDRDKYYTVLQDEEGRLFLGDFDSPLERYAPQTWWEVVHDTK